MKCFFKLSSALLLVLSLALQSCIDSPDTSGSEQFTKDVQAIDTYLVSNNINAIKDIYGIRMDIHELGTGLVPIYKSSVTVEYAGKVLGSTTNFDSGTANGELKNYITGWQIAMTSLPVGSKATIYIPSSLGYATQEKPGIPKNSILVFDVYLKAMYTSPTETNQFKSDTTAIETYLSNKGITNYVEDPTGVRYVKTQVVNAAPAPSLYTKVKFSVALKNLSDDSKTVLNITREPSDSFNGRVIDNIRGLQALLPNMRKGEKATAYIPSYLAFNTDGVQDTGGTMLVPANSPVIMEVELLDVY